MGDIISLSRHLIRITETAEGWEVTIEPCPPRAKPEAVFWKPHLARSYADMLVDRYGGRVRFEGAEP